jgi:hypothetical protein
MVVSIPWNTTSKMVESILLEQRVDMNDKDMLGIVLLFNSAALINNFVP